MKRRLVGLGFDRIGGELGHYAITALFPYHVLERSRIARVSGRWRDIQPLPITSSCSVATDGRRDGSSFRLEIDSDVDPMRFGQRRVIVERQRSPVVSKLTVHSRPAPCFEDLIPIVLG